jgi:pimeloyl-ACP methyl ester carboxylesterase
VHWVGDSTGGAVGMAAALLAPQRISSITACNTTAKMAQQTVDTYAIGEKDQAAAIEKFGVTESTSSRRSAASAPCASSSPYSGEEQC